MVISSHRALLEERFVNKDVRLPCPWLPSSVCCVKYFVDHWRSFSMNVWSVVSSGCLLKSFVRKHLVPNLISWLWVFVSSLRCICLSLSLCSKHATLSTRISSFFLLLLLCFIPSGPLNNCGRDRSRLSAVPVGSFLPVDLLCPLRSICGPMGVAKDLLIRHTLSSLVLGRSLNLQ